MSQLSKLLHSSGLTATITLISRLLGFVRDLILAQVFGASGVLDAFLIAFKLPNFMRRLFGEGAFAQAFVPVLSELKIKHHDVSIHDFIARISGCLITALIVVTGLAELGAPWIMHVVAPGFANDPQQWLLATHLLKLTFPYLLFITLAAMASAILNTYHQFSAPAFTPVLLNLTLIIAVLVFAPHTQQPIVTLTIAVPIAGIIQWLFLCPFLAKYQLLVWPRWEYNDVYVRRVIKLMLPVLLGASVTQIGILIDNLFASFLPQGSISWLYYSDRLTYLPLGVIGVALSTVILPQLSNHVVKKEQQAYWQTLDWGLSLVLLLGLPAALGLALLAKPILATLMYHGAFDRYDVVMTAHSLMAFSLGLPGFMLVKILTTGFYAHQNLKTPVYIALICLMVNIVLNFLLVSHLAHAGLALSTALASSCNAGLLWFWLVKRKDYRTRKFWLKLMTQILFALAIMSTFLLCLRSPLQKWLTWSLGKKVEHLSLLIILSGLIYLGGLWIAGVRKPDIIASY